MPQQHRLGLMLALSWLAVAPATLSAQPAFRVADLTAPGTPEGAPFLEMAETGGVVFFTAGDPLYGYELWRTDGTEAGTFLLKDLCLGSCGSVPHRLTVVDGQVYFTTADELGFWRTDGTPAGTVRVSEHTPQDVEKLGNEVFFAGPAGLWKSDGTDAGTVLLKEHINPNNSGSTFLGRAAGFLFLSIDRYPEGRELWRTDGTVAGTVLVKDIAPGSEDSLEFSFVEDFPGAGGKLFFRARTPETGFELWVTDGTAEGTRLVKDLAPGPDWGFPKHFVARGSEVFFLSGQDLWKSDGTEAGTVLLKAGTAMIPSGPGIGLITDLVVAGGQVFFRGIDPDFGREVWKTDGTVAGTQRVTDVAAGAGHALAHDQAAMFAALGDGLVFFANDGTTGTEPWITDGTQAGTVRLADLRSGAAGSFVPADRYNRGIVSDGRWFFSALDAEGAALWVSDGTGAGTRVVRRFPPLWGSTLDHLAEHDGSLFFVKSWDELWRSDGSEGGTSLVRETPNTYLEKLTSWNGHLYFSDYGSLWRTDGTEAGTQVVDETPDSYVFHLIPTETGLFYGTVGQGPYYDLRMTDGAAAGQHLAHLNAINVAPPVPFRNGVAFTAGELWLSDGTAAGTSQVTSSHGISPGQRTVAAGGRLFFWAFANFAGTEPWVSDGTLAGTRLLRDVWPGWDSSLARFYDRPTAAVGHLWFFLANDGVSGEELWVSDGTSPGTRRARDIHPGSESSRIGRLTPGRDRLYFTADDGVHGEELWVSDGTEAGTRMVRDINPGPETSAPRDLAAIGHVLLFAAFDPDHGVELWRTDGTEAGTVRLQDIAPGPAPSTPGHITAAGPYVYFTANDGVSGVELWALPRSVLGSALAATKTATGEHILGGTVVYTIAISNVGAGPHPDNPGDELVDVLPAGLTLVGATADVGSVSLDIPARRVAWNGGLPIGGSATLTIEATVDALPGAVLRNQASLSFDADGNGANETSAVSDAPAGSGASDPTDIVISSGPTDFYTVSPCRAVDTRTSSPLTAGTPRTFTVAGLCGVPADAGAIAVNVTVFGPAALGNVVAWPAGLPTPGTSSVNFLAGVNRANNAILELGGGEIQALARMAAGGEVHFILDVVGYFGE